MSGHSKWHNIRIKKQKADLVRGKLFSKFAREIAVAAREGGPNPEGNARLRTAIERAREVGMPNDNIQRAIQRGAGGAEGASYEAITYEGYAPGGVAVLVEVLTDNRNRTAADVRSLFTKHGGALGEVGSVAWMFDRRGMILVDRTKVQEDDLLLAALEAGADDVRSTAEAYEIVTAPEQLDKVKQALAAARIPIQSAEVTMVPKSTVPVGPREAKQVLALMDALEDHDDVQRAYANFDIPDEILQQVG
ncbi:MAG: YebC/PmpR family DNA-binding transcriptional regulator [Armatimonadota bacterium]|nr:YebC/PmpR family DNA-binding transcriptional regulator [Armatimonadota bacterium]MDR7452420.1 YebC/PmpR family DNA-binding transcriptional regulator [Armatimonadota bacterium]MDR7468089.1 YebC/PmpR family DNA-binding transcriptional regulator [Armatimonadota bacterium]MDR7494659.1 YebC/PmpR family DNA-binding transcriptional regulator [Armatimonadota bacterium]MDR7500208.1 YebC/PmpR family DNA-binding transcriptional regulator [Armatimonadota bacterium]